MSLITMMKGVGMKSLFRSALLVGVMGLVGCGGGTGGSSPTGSSSSSFGSSLASSSSTSSAQAPVALQPITRASAPYFAASVFDAFDVASIIPTTIAEMLSQINLLKDGQFSSSCSNGGTYSVVIRSNPSSMRETFTNCREDGDIRNGHMYFEAVPSGDGAYRALIRYDNLTITSAIDTSASSKISGDIKYEGEIGGRKYDNQFYTVRLNITEQDSEIGEYSLQDAVFRLPYFTSDSFFPHKFRAEQSYSGKIVISEMGSANFEYNAIEKKVEITGSTDAIARITYDDEELFIYWDAENDGLMEAQLFIAITNNISDLIGSSDGKIVPSGIDGLILERDSFYISRGDSLEIDFRKALTHSGISLLNYTLLVDGASSETNDWNQVEPGRFLLSFGSNVEDKTYDLIFRITDADERNVYDIPVSFFVGSDYDADGTPDAFDDDDDNDGVRDQWDAYPFDKDESADTDGDGIPDNRDADADGDGVPNFADNEPLDASNCAELSERDSGSCYLQGRRVGVPWMMDAQGILYFESYLARFGVRDSNSYMYRLDSDLSQFLEPIRGVSQRSFFVAATNTLIYKSGDEIYQVNLDTQETHLLIQFEESFRLEYAEEKHFVITRAHGTASESTYVESYNYRGQLLSQKPLYTDGRLAMVIAQSQLDPNCPVGLTSDFYGELYLVLSRYDGSYCIPNPLLMSRLSPDGTKLYRPIVESSDGGIFSTKEYLEYGSIDINVNDQPLITISPFSHFEWVGENYVVQRQDSLVLHDSTGAEIASVEFDDEEIQELFTNAERIAVVSHPNNSRRTLIRMFDAQLNFINSYEY